MLAAALRTVARPLRAGAASLVRARAGAVGVAAARGMATTPEMTIRDALNSAIDEEMERDPTVFIIGACAARVC